jgi:S-adenosyl-L-methionine hydrolase (adenosine-forming)
MAPIITLLTDYGLKDGYVASLKGSILGICAQARLIDISHLVQPQDVRSGAFLLSTVYKDFPPGTIHLAIIDPGVGTKRQGLVLRTPEYFLVGPDNGLFSWVCRKEPDWEARSLENPQYWRSPVSPTFHGRDIFAPVAAHLAAGVAMENLGVPWEPQIAGWTTMVRSDRTLRGEVIHVDYFGNIITNLDEETVNGFAPAEELLIEIQRLKLNGLTMTYGEQPVGAMMALIGSHGYLEIAANQQHAGKLLDVRTGTPVRLTYPKP